MTIRPESISRVTRFSLSISVWIRLNLGRVIVRAAMIIVNMTATAAAIISLFVLGVLGPIEKYFERRQAFHRRVRQETDQKKAERKQNHESQ